MNYQHQIDGGGYPDIFMRLNRSAHVVSNALASWLALKTFTSQTWSVSGVLTRIGARQQKLGLASYLASWRANVSLKQPAEQDEKHPAGTYRIVWLHKRCPLTPGYRCGDMRRVCGPYLQSFLP